MPLIYKIDVLQSLKDKGLSSYKLRQEKILSESTLQKIRKRQAVSWENLETLCMLLECQPSDLIEYVKEETVSKRAD